MHHVVLFVFEDMAVPDVFIPDDTVMAQQIVDSAGRDYS
jgi:hypothetical protein